MMKKTIFFLFLGMTVFLSSPVFARSMEGYNKGKDCLMMMGKGQCGCPLANKVEKKADFLLEHKTDIGLTADQVKTIKGLKLQVDKDVIRQSADMKTAVLDLDAKLTEDTVDVEGTSVLIDKNFAAAAAAAKSNLNAYAQLKAVLTQDQIAKMKTIYGRTEQKWKEER